MDRVLSFTKAVLKVIIYGVTILFLRGFSTDALAAQTYNIGIVTAGRLNVRTEPKIIDPPLTVLSQGAKVLILEQLDGWIKISYQQQVGYIRNRQEYLRIIQIEAPEATQVIGDNETDIQRIKKEAQNISQKIQKGQVKVQTFTQKASAIIHDLNGLDLALNAARKRSVELKSELPALEEQIAETTRISKDLVKRIEIDQEYVSNRLVSFYKLNWLGHLNVLASADSVYDLFQRKKALELILAHDQATIERLVQSKADLQLLLVRQNAQKAEKLSLEADLGKQIRIMSDKRAKRFQLLEEIRSQKSLEMAAIESLK
ncbi:MAG: SH3 domain-containing protein, partial [Proteobacteria bacterium]|nr:SH3 domain-containing protein [Pseudomonadota bacterium]